MKTNQALLFFIVTITALSISSCAKDGDTGPQGPAGTNGSSNVKSVIFTVNPGDWLTYLSPGQTGHCKWYEINIPFITNNVMNNGAVLGFVKEGDYWSSLPFTGYTTTDDFYIHPVSRLNYFEVEYFISSVGTPNITTSFEFKAVVIDGTARILNPDLNWNDYASVAKRFNLQD